MFLQDPEAEVKVTLIPTEDLLDPEATPSFDKIETGDEEGG